MKKFWDAMVLLVFVIALAVWLITLISAAGDRSTNNSERPECLEFFNTRSPTGHAPANFVSTVRCY